MKASIENTIERVIDYVEIHSKVDYPSKKREQTTKWATEIIMDIIKTGTQPIIDKLNKMLK